MTQEKVRWAVVGTGGTSTLIPGSERLGAAQRIAEPVLKVEEVHAVGDRSRTRSALEAVPGT